MTIFLTTLIALWVNPIISFLIVYFTKSKIRIYKNLIIYSIFINSIVVFCLLTNISTTAIEVDFFILAIFHFAICILLWLGFFHKKEIIKVFSILIMFMAFTIGYFLSTVGILGIAFFAGDFEPAKELRINNSIVYKEYGLGNATTSWGGIKVSLSTNYYWFPFLEREFFSKKYIGGSNIDSNQKFITPENSDVNSRPSFYANAFEIKYDTVQNEIILIDNNKTDTLNLK